MLEHDYRERENAHTENNERSVNKNESVGERLTKGKLTDFSGDKGVVFGVLKDRDMPIDTDGTKEVTLILNSYY